MAFCINCGEKLSEGAKFCAYCGTPVSVKNSKTSQRRTVYEGELHKCPNCGEILNSFVVECPACGYELRGATAVNSVKEFERKFSAAKTNEQKIDLIKTFAIPNTKEDVREFLILALSNIDTNVYGLKQEDESRIQISDAWISKFEQAYQKAKIWFDDASDLEEFRGTYEKKKRKIASARKCKRVAWFIENHKKGVSIFLGLAFFLLMFLSISIPHKVQEYKLEKLAAEVERYISAGDYETARIKANQIIDDTGYSEESEEKWNRVRKTFLAMIEEKQAIAEGKIPVGIDHAEIVGLNYKDVFNRLSEQGFTNIETVPIKDLIAGWLMEDGEVEEVTISGDNDYVENTRYFTDAKITITYHTFKSEATESESMKQEDLEIDIHDTTVKRFVFGLPEYWKEEGSKNEYLQYFAEKGEKVVMLSIAYPEETDDTYDVSFEGLYADNENMIEAVGGMFTDGDVVDYEVIELECGIKGILYRFTYKQRINWLQSVDGSGYYFCFPSEEDRRWFYIVLTYTNNVAGDRYKDDYMNLISTIREKE